VSFLRKQESRALVLLKSPSPGQPVGWPASPARGEAVCFIRLKCYQLFSILRPGSASENRRGKRLQADAQLFGFFQIGGRLGMVSLLAVSDGSVLIGPGVVGIDPNHLAECGNRFIPPA